MLRKFTSKQREKSKQENHNLHSIRTLFLRCKDCQSKMIQETF